MAATSPETSLHLIGEAPSKVFLLGEYLALVDGPAIVATFPPNFSLRSAASSLKGTNESIPFFEALTGSFQESFFTFVDPWGGRGGLGASSARFALTYIALCEARGLTPSLMDCLTYYRKAGRSKLPPSGADLIAQWAGGVTDIDSPFNARYEPVPDQPLFSKFLIFSATLQAGRKIPTDKHLEELEKGDFLESIEIRAASLKDVMTATREAIRANDAPSLGRWMNEYADQLLSNGLEIDATSKDREAFKKLKGVLGVKGSGALQADAIIVLHDGQKESKATILALASQRGLNLVADGLKASSGIRHASKLSEKMVTYG